MHTYRHFNLNSFLPERLVYAESAENSSEAETPKNTTEAPDNTEDMTEVTEQEGDKAAEKLEREADRELRQSERQEEMENRPQAIKRKAREVSRVERRKEVDSEFKDAVENLIKLQGDGKYNILLRGEWVPATVDNRLARQRGIWERQEGAKGGDTNQFMNQERYAENKKEERRKRYADRNEDKDAFKQGEKERRKDEAQLWALQAGWEFKRPFKEITKSKKGNENEEENLEATTEPVTAPVEEEVNLPPDLPSDVVSNPPITWGDMPELGNESLEGVEDENVQSNNSDINTPEDLSRKYSVEFKNDDEKILAVSYVKYYKAKFGKEPEQNKLIKELVKYRTKEGDLTLEDSTINTPEDLSKYSVEFKNDAEKTLAFTYVKYYHSKFGSDPSKKDLTKELSAYRESLA